MPATKKNADTPSRGMDTPTELQGKRAASSDRALARDGGCAPGLDRGRHQRAPCDQQEQGRQEEEAQQGPGDHLPAATVTT